MKYKDRMFTFQCVMLIVSSVFLAGDWVVEREGGWLTFMFWTSLALSWLFEWLGRRES